MTEQNVIETIKEVYGDKFFDLDADFRDLCPNADSMLTIGLAAAIDKKYKTEISQEAYMKLSTAPTPRKYIEVLRNYGLLK